MGSIGLSRVCQLFTVVLNSPTVAAANPVWFTPVTIKDHHGLEAVFVIVGIEQAQLLVVVDGIESFVDI